MTQDDLKKALRYDPESGNFFWLHTTGRAAAGSVAGTIKPSGYRCIKIGKTNFYAHRLAWLYVHGVWPPDQIDHINCDRDDNRICNLRKATGTQNQGNRRPKGKRKGITYHRHDKRWQAQISINGKYTYLGQYSTQEEAFRAYEKAAREHFGEFARFSA
jgi:hypothetical protein